MCAPFKKITADLVHKTSSRAKPKEVVEMMELALKGDFQKSRESLNKLMISYGLGGDDILMQMYREVSGLSIPEDKKMALIGHIGEFNFRMVEGANERIQLEALLAQMVLLIK